MSPLLIGALAALGVLLIPVLFAVVARAQAQRARRHYIMLHPRVGLERKDK